MSEEITVEGYRVVIERLGDAYTVSVPELPGCTIQVNKKEDARKEIARTIGLYWSELASRKLKPKKPSDEMPPNNTAGRKGHLLQNKK